MRRTVACGTRRARATLAVAVLCCACAGTPAGTRLTTLQHDPASTLEPPGSTVVGSGNTPLHNSISGKQRAALTRQVTSSTSCAQVISFYQDALARTGWHPDGGLNHFIDDLTNLGWDKPGLRFALATESAAPTGSAPPPPPAGGCLFRLDLQGD